MNDLLAPSGFLRYMHWSRIARFKHSTVTFPAIAVYVDTVWTWLPPAPRIWWVRPLVTVMAIVETGWLLWLFRPPDVYPYRDPWEDR